MKYALTAVAALIVIGNLAGCGTPMFPNAKPLTPEQSLAQQRAMQSLIDLQRPYYPAGSPSAGTNCFTTRNALGYNTSCH